MNDYRERIERNGKKMLERMRNRTSKGDNLQDPHEEWSSLQGRIDNQTTRYNNKQGKLSTNRSEFEEESK
jgi:hypothetical protein